MRRKTKRILGVFLLLCCMLAVFTACNKSIEEQILGSWVPAGGNACITFYNRGTFTLEPWVGDDMRDQLMAEGDWSTAEGDWSISDKNMLTVSLEGMEFTYEVTDISSDSMTWEYEGESAELLKVD